MQIQKLSKKDQAQLLQRKDYLNLYNQTATDKPKPPQPDFTEKAEQVSPMKRKRN
jgi:hypothetical protein